jgi:NAD(P)-dependent dehydrogenase (short-subunit alcohol dehydrogenase family)
MYIIQMLVVLLSISVFWIWRMLILCPLSLTPVDMQGKIVLVTGGSAGIGLETVKILHDWNATIIMPVRNLTKGLNVVNDIRLHSTSTSHIDLYEVDLASFQSIRQFASSVLLNYNHIDVLILNAGMHGIDHIVTTVDGIEMTYQVNHLSHFLLTRLLLHKVTRIVHVSSFMHFFGIMDHDAYAVSSLNKNKDTARLDMDTYKDTKLMNVIFSNALENRLRKDNKYVNTTSVSIHPGYVISDIDRGHKYQSIMMAIRKLVARSTYEGSITQIAAATSPFIISQGGGLYYEDHCIMDGCRTCNFIVKCNREIGGVVPHNSATNIDEQNWLWNVSSAIVGLSVEL